MPGTRVTKGPTASRVGQLNLCQLDYSTNQINDKTIFRGNALQQNSFRLVFLNFWLHLGLVGGDVDTSLIVEGAVKMCVCVCGAVQEICLTGCQQMSWSTGQILTGAVLRAQRGENKTSSSEASRQSHLPHGLFSYKKKPYALHCSVLTVQTKALGTCVYCKCLNGAGRWNWPQTLINL